MRFAHSTRFNRSQRLICPQDDFNIITEAPPDAPPPEV